MDIKIINKLDEITNIIENDKENNELKKLKNKIENNHELLNKIKELKQLDKYDSKYIKLKEEILSNEDFKNYKELEKDLYYVVMSINKRLNSIKEKSGCN